MDRVRLLRRLPLAALLLVGCRNDPFTVQYIEEVNNQNRQLEDIIYEQDYQLDVLKQELEDLKKRADYLKTERRRPAPRRLLDNRQPPAMEPDDGLAPPVIEGPEMNSPAPAAPAEVPNPVPPPRIVPEDPLPPPRRRTPPPMDPPVNPAPLEEPPARPRGNDFQPPAEPEPRVPTPPIPPIGPTSLPQVEALPKIEPEAPPAPPGVESLPPPLKSPPLKIPSQMLQTQADPPPSPALGPSISPEIVPPLAATIPTAAGDEPPAPPAEVTPLAKPTALFLHPLYTGGEDTDGRPGDEGLSILIEPRTDSGEFVPAVGKVSLALLDPTRKGDEARVARWDFDADYVRRRMKTLTTQRGILLHTLWTDGPPKSNRLKLFVRLETEAGEKLEAQREVFVALPGQLSNRWTPRTANGEPAEVARQPGAPIGDRITGELSPEQKLPTQLTPLAPPRPEFKPEPQPEIPTRKDRPKKGLIVPPAALGDSP